MGDDANVDRDSMLRNSTERARVAGFAGGGLSWMEAAFAGVSYSNVCFDLLYFTRFGTSIIIKSNLS